MTLSDGPGSDSRKLLAGATIKVQIAVVSTLVLVVGAWLAPRAIQPALTAPQEHAAPLLEEQVQLRQATRPFAGVQDVGAAAKQHTIAIPLARPVTVPSRTDFSEIAQDPFQVAGFGVFVTDRYVLTHVAALDGRSSVELSHDNVGAIARVAAFDAATGLVLLETPPTRAGAPRLARDPLPAGALAVGVGRSQRGDVAVPVFITSVSATRYAIGAVNGSIPPGMPVFTLAGELFAIAAPDGRDVSAVAVKDVMDRLIMRAVRKDRPSSFGVGFQALDDGLRRTFGDEGIVITRVIEGGPAAIAGIQVGDVVLSVADAALDSVEKMTTALSSAAIGAPTTWRLRRGRRVLQVDVTPAPAYEVASLARAADGAGSGPEARVIFPAAVIEAAAIPPSARVLSVNGRAVASRAQVQRELRVARAPVPVLLQHGENRFFAAIEPPR